MAPKLLFVLFLFVPVSESHQTTEKLRKGAILNQMREWGTRTFKSKLYTRRGAKKQFLVAAVITPSILNDVTGTSADRRMPITTWNSGETNV